MSTLQLIGAAVLVAGMPLYWVWMGRCLDRASGGLSGERRRLIERRISPLGSPPPLVERRRGRDRRSQKP